MKKSLIAALVAAAFVVPGFASAAEPASPHTVTYNVGFVSDYLFRGVSQTHGDPAVQGGIDYAHSSGFYAGAWGSTIKWVEDAQNRDVPVEIDLYGGYKGSLGADLGYDLGLIAYFYPGSKDTPANFSADADTQEVYAALTWKFLTLKYSYAISDHFIGWYGGPAGGDLNQDTKGSNYLELNAAYDMGDGWTLIGHIGHQKVNNYEAVGDTDASYTDWKIGVTKDVGFGVLGASWSDTDTKGNCPSTGFAAAGTDNAYCWATWDGTSYDEGRNASKGRLVVSFSKTF